MCSKLIHFHTKCVTFNRKITIRFHLLRFFALIQSQPIYFFVYCFDLWSVTHIYYIHTKIERLLLSAFASELQMAKHFYKICNIGCCCWFYWCCCCGRYHSFQYLIIIITIQLTAAASLLAHHATIVHVWVLAVGIKSLYGPEYDCVLAKDMFVLGRLLNLWTDTKTNIFWLAAAHSTRRCDRVCVYVRPCLCWCVSSLSVWLVCPRLHSECARIMRF